MAFALAPFVPGLAVAAPTLPATEIFAPGIISGPANDGSPSFTPDGKTLFFTRSGARAGVIMESHFVSDAWSTPEIASFSGAWNDQHPFVAPDGSYLVFVSTRPAPRVSGKVAHLWRVDRAGAGWGTPVHLPATVNNGPRIFAPSVAADGTIYFLGIGANRVLQLYRARNVNGEFVQAEPLSFSSPATADVDPLIAPDQSFIVFASSGRHGNDDKQEHLFIAFNDRGAWQAPKQIAYSGDDGSSNDNEPDLSPDGKTLYFASDRTLPIMLPHTRAQTEADLARIAAWDNGNSNVWTLPFSAAAFKGSPS